MIFKEEIQKIATAKKLGIDIVEKDYILSWVLAGIHHHNATKNSWIFKGGTCLKKCYFETYRFSEDLDFTYHGEPIETHDNRKFLESEWTVQLRHQMPELPPFALFLDELKKVLDWISNKNPV